MGDTDAEILDHLRRIEDRLTAAEGALGAITEELRELRALAERRTSSSTVTFMGGMGVASTHDTREQ